MAVKRVAVKKAAVKKAAVKKAAKSPKQSPKKTAVKTSAKKSVPADRSRSQQMIDQMLVKINPNLQEKINSLVQVLENSREGRMGDLSLLAGKILLRAQDISKSIKNMRKGR